MAHRAKKIVYICFGFAMRSPVIDSQVINWIQRFHEEGVQIQLIAFDGIRAVRENRKLLHQRLATIRAVTGECPVHFTLPFPHHPFSLGLANVILLIYLLPQLAVGLVRGRKLLIHSRGEQGILAAQMLKRLFPTCELLYDVRGAVVDEYVYMAQASGLANESIQQKAAILRHREATALRVADKINAVSSALLQYLAHFHDLQGKVTSVIPCSADEALFYFDPAVRAQVRHDLNVEDKKVLVYAGTLYQWQSLDKIIELFLQLQAYTDESLFLLILTPNQDEAQALLRKHLAAESFLVTAVNNAEVSAYLMAGDIGLLLREKHPLNAVASPTKFAEYIMCGLPVLVSAGIGDTEQWVREHAWGFVVEDLCFTRETIEGIGAYLCGSPGRKPPDKISQEGTMLLSKRTILAKAISLYD